MKEQFQAPAYYRVAKDIKAEIEQGQLKPGDTIPSEAKLSSRYGVSRMTVRQGLSQLVQIGYIKSVQGKGNFVAYPKIDQLVIDLSDKSLFGDPDNLKVKLLSVDVIAAGDQEAQKLELAVSTKILKVRRLLSKEEGPFALDIRCLPYLKGKPLLEKEISYAAFPELVIGYTELLSVRNNLAISPTVLSVSEATLLEASPGLPALCLEQVLHAYDDRPMGWSKMICRGDRYTLNAVSYPYSKEQ